MRAYIQVLIQKKIKDGDWLTGIKVGYLTLLAYIA